MTAITRSRRTDTAIGLTVIACAITAGVAVVAGAPYIAGATLAASLLADTKPWRRRTSSIHPAASAAANRRRA